MQLSEQTYTSSFEPLLAANFEACLAAEKARRAAYEQAPVSPLGWNEDKHYYEPNRDDMIDMQDEQAVEHHDFVAHHGDFPF